MGPKHQGWLVDSGVRRKNTKDKRGQMQIAWGLLAKPLPCSEPTNAKIIREREFEKAKRKVEVSRRKRKVNRLVRGKPLRILVTNQLSMFD